MNESVIKVGGSLFSRPQLFDPIANWIGSRCESGSCVSVVAGGGKFVDAIRELNLAEKVAHQLACEMMGVTAKIAGKLLGLPVVEPGNAWEQPVVRDLSGWALEQKSLPCDWSATSDSIAALWANACGDAELVLVKSSAPEGSAIKELVENGFIDSFFPVAAKGLSQIRVACVEGESRVVEYPLNWGK